MSVKNNMISIMKKLGIYKAVEWTYFKLVHPNKDGGTRVYEDMWRKRGVDDNVKDWESIDGKDWIENYWLSTQHPHRKVLVEKIGKFQPDSVFEIGCNCGVNLYLLAKKYPKIQLYGTDINISSIHQGITYFKKEGLNDRVIWYNDKADELYNMDGKSVDVVFTDAVLIYIADDKIDEVISEMIRVAKKGIVLVEWNIPSIFDKDKHGLGIYHKGLWMRDYHSLFQKHGIDAVKIKSTKITRDVWDEDNWSDVGYFIEVEL